VLLLLGLLTLPFAIAVAVLRYRLYEIERIISRTVTCGVVTALVVAVYLVTVFLLRLVMPVEGQLAVAGSTLATAALFNPLRRRVQHWSIGVSTGTAMTPSVSSRASPGDCVIVPTWMR